MNILFKCALVLPTFALVSACSDGTMINPPEPQRLVLETHNESNGQSSTKQYEYDANNNIAREIYGQGDDAAIRSYQVSESGRVTGSTWDSEGDGSPEYQVDYVYADNGNLVQINEYNFASQMYEYAYVLNYENGLVTSVDDYDIDNVPTADLINLSTDTPTTDQSFEYENGRLSVVNDLYFLDGSVYAFENFSYNPDGTVSTATKSDVDFGVSSTIVMEYEFRDCNTSNYISINQYYCVK